jgi:hypothetical protein
MNNIDLKVITRIFVETDEKYLRIKDISYMDNDLMLNCDFTIGIYSDYFKEEEGIVKVRGLCTLKRSMLDIINYPQSINKPKFKEIKIYSVYLPDKDYTVDAENILDEFLKIDYDTLTCDILDFSDINFYVKFLEIE